MATVDQELLFAIRGIEVLLESGVGVAEAMKHIADEDYGDLSGIFKVRPKGPVFRTLLVLEPLGLSRSKRIACGFWILN